MIKLHNSVDLYGQSKSSSINNDETDYLEFSTNWHPLLIKCMYFEHIFSILIENNEFLIWRFYEYLL